MKLKELTIQEKIGQMLMVGMDTNYITDRIKNLIQVHKIGGIILYRKNFGSYNDMINLINELKELNKENRIPLFIAVDQEGGRVNRLPSEIKNLPSASKIANNGGEKLVKEAYDIIGEILNKAGFNVNFAPVLDIKRKNITKAIGDRSFSDDKEKVASFGITAMQTLQSHNIVSAIKHFPGHGSTSQDSHLFLPVLNADIAKEDMYPFEQAIQNGADALLVGHLIIRNITGIYPASLSKTLISKYIRMKYKYNGLIITDDLKMRAIRFIYGADLAMKKAIDAGNDIIVFRFNQEEEKRVISKFEMSVKRGKIKEKRINKSVKRILKIKEKYQITDDSINEKLDIDKINERINNIIEKCKKN